MSNHDLLLVIDLQNVYTEGQHAFNMGQRSKLTSIRAWPQRMADWLEDRGLLKADGKTAMRTSH